jgi:hypothetical protein
MKRGVCDFLGVSSDSQLQKWASRGTLTSERADVLGMTTDKDSIWVFRISWMVCYDHSGVFWVFAKSKRE